MRVYGFQEIERWCIHFFWVRTWPKKNPKIHVKKTMHDLQSKPTTKRMLWTCLRNKQLAKKLLNTHTSYTHTYILEGGGRRLPTTQKLSWKWVSNTCIQTHTHTTSFAIHIYSFFKHNGIITCIRHGINCAI